MAAPFEAMSVVSSPLQVAEMLLRPLPWGGVVAGAELAGRPTSSAELFAHRSAAVEVLAELGSLPAAAERLHHVSASCGVA